MRIKEIIISTVLMLVSCLAIFGAFKLESSFEPPESKILVTNFDGGLVNTLDNEISLLEFGDLAIENKSIIGKGVGLNGGYITLYGSEQTKLRDEFTFSTWFNITDAKSQDPFIFSRGTATDKAVRSSIALRFSDDYTCFKTDIGFKLAGSKYGNYSFVSKKLFDKESIINEWHNITIVFDKNVLYYYFDGALSSAEILPVELLEYATIFNNDKVFEIGRGSKGNMFGILDEIHFYDYAVGKEEAIAFYTKGMEKYKNKLVVNVENKTVELNGVKEEVPDLTEEKGITLISVDFIVEKMNGTMTFDEKDGYGRMDIIQGNNKISLWLMDTNAVVNDKLSKLDVHPAKKGEVILAPVRFIAEGLGAMLSWNKELKELTIYYK